MNLELYEKMRVAPENALREIKAGRLKGKTDINPMWRIKALTEQFGPCGIGWKYTIDRQWIEPGANGEVSAFVNISLYIKVNGEWSEAIPGTGGSSFVASERNGLYTSDECYKMALTDAISVAGKALGMAADVYWGMDKTKYTKDEIQDEKPLLCLECHKPITGFTDKKGKYWSPAAFANSYGGKCLDCIRKIHEENKKGVVNG